jgi:hypothetical protein
MFVQRNVFNNLPVVTEPLENIKDNWGISVMVIPDFLNQPWGWSNDPYCNAPDKLLKAKAADYGKRKYLPRQTKSFPFLNEPAVFYNPETRFSWEGVALKKCINFPTTIARIPRSGTICLGTPLIIGKTELGLPIFLNKVYDPEKASRNIPAEVLQKPLVILVRNLLPKFLPRTNFAKVEGLLEGIEASTSVQGPQKYQLWPSWGALCK